MLGGSVGIGGDPRIKRVSVVATRSKRMSISVIRAAPIGIHVLSVRGPSTTSYENFAAAETTASSEITICQCFAPNCRNDSLFIGVSIGCLPSHTSVYVFLLQWQLVERWRRRT